MTSAFQRFAGAGLVVALTMASATLLWMLLTARAQHTEAIARIERANRDLEERVAALQAEAAALREKLGVPHPADHSAAVRPPGRSKPVEPPSGADTTLQLSQLQSKLAQANSAITSLQARTREMEETIEKLTAENSRALASEADLKERMAGLQRVVSAMETEIKSKTDRLVQLEQAARKAVEDGAANAQRLAQVGSALTELEEINRRRENALTSLNRRFRDLTDQYRAFALRLDTQRDNPASPLMPDVSRIQTAVQGAEEELRQLISLNTQAQRVAAKLTRK